MIKLQNNTPSVYTEGSRDFQLFLRLYDCIINGVKFDIDNIINLLDPFKINDRLIELLSTRVGFFPKRVYDTKLLRYIIKAFPYLIKNKGSKKGIEGAVCTVLKVEGNFSVPQIIIDNKNYFISIYTPIEIYNKKALEELLEYVIPIGYTFSIEKYTSYDKGSTLIDTSNKISMLNIPTVSASQVRGSDRIKELNPKDKNATFNFKTDIQDKYINNITTGEIIGSNNYIFNEENQKGFTKDRNNTLRNNIDQEKWITNKEKEGK